MSTLNVPIVLIDVPIVLIGALAVAISAFHDFHRPDRPSDIRYATTRNRYLIGICVYAMFNLLGYGLLVAGCYKLGLMATGAPNERMLAWAAIIATVLSAAVLPNIRGTREFFAEVHAAARALALYPSELQRLLSVISQAGFDLQEKPDELAKEWARYGVSLETAAQLPQSATQLLREISLLQMSFVDLRSPVESQEPGNEGRDWRSRSNTYSIRSFLEAQSETLLRIEINYRQLVRRSARALLLIEDIQNESDRTAICLELSRFIADEGADLLARYRACIAGAALSCIPGPAARERFLSSFGYDISLPPASRSLGSVLAAAFALTLIWAMFPMILPWLSGSFAAADRLLLNRVIFTAASQAIAMTVAIAWAIYPKAVSTYARPSFFSLPVHTYFRYGLASYATGVLILYFGVYVLGRADMRTFLIVLLTAIPFPLMTAGLSFRIDLRLRSRRYDFGGGRLRDGLVIVLLWLTGFVISQFAAFSLFFHQSLPSSPFLFIYYLTGPLILGGFWIFLIGFFVPATAAARLEARTLQTREDFRRHGSLLGQLRRSDASAQEAISAAAATGLNSAATTVTSSSPQI